MCLTVPRRVIAVEGTRAQLQDGRWVLTSMIGNVDIGDMVLAQANLAVEKIHPEDAYVMKSMLASEEESV